MNTQRLPDFPPDGVRRLDAVLNTRICAARGGRELNHRLREKVRIKRRIVSLPDALVEIAALQELARLDGGARR